MIVPLASLNLLILLSFFLSNLHIIYTFVSMWRRPSASWPGFWAPIHHSWLSLVTTTGPIKLKWVCSNQHPITRITKVSNWSLPSCPTCTQDSLLTVPTVPKIQSLTAGKVNYWKNFQPQSFLSSVHYATLVIKLLESGQKPSMVPYIPQDKVKLVSSKPSKTGPPKFPSNHPNLSSLIPKLTLSFLIPFYVFVSC